MREHRNSIPKGAGPGSRPAAGHLTTAVRPAPRRHITSAVKAAVMARKRPAPKYAGALAQPIYVDQDPPGLLELHRYPDVDVAKLKWMQRAAEKMRLLFEHYKIDPSDEQSLEKLAIRLAFEHVPGLQLAFRPKPGRKPTWRTGLGDELVLAVEDVKSRTGKRTKDAIAKLKEEPGGMWGRYTFENLGARYRETRVRQKALASLSQLLNAIDLSLGPSAPSATASPLGRAARDDQSASTKIGARAKTSRRK